MLLDHIVPRKGKVQEEIVNMLSLLISYRGLRVNDLMEVLRKIRKGVLILAVSS
jgi:hypothetical protein